VHRHLAGTQETVEEKVVRRIVLAGLLLFGLGCASVCPECVTEQNFPVGHPWTPDATGQHCDWWKGTRFGCCPYSKLEHERWPPPSPRPRTCPPQSEGE
jgi:hypothetical protein